MFQPKKTIIHFITFIIFYYCSLLQRSIFRSLRIKRCASECLFKIIIFSISFSNVKCIWVSSESLMIELYLHMKFIWIIFQESWNTPNLENQRVLHFEFQCQKLLWSYHNTYILLFCIYLSTKLYQCLGFSWTHLPLF